VFQTSADQPSHLAFPRGWSIIGRNRITSLPAGGFSATTIASPEGPRGLWRASQGSLSGRQPTFEGLDRSGNALVVEPSAKRRPKLNQPEQRFLSLRRQERDGVAQERP
jgi:hypothetical protein